MPALFAAESGSALPDLPRLSKLLLTLDELVLVNFAATSAAPRATRITAVSPANLFRLVIPPLPSMTVAIRRLCARRNHLSSGDVSDPFTVWKGKQLRDITESNVLTPLDITVGPGRRCA